MITGIKIDATRLNCSHRKMKMEQVRDELFMVINSQLFRDKIMRADFSGERSVHKTKSKIEIYKMLMKGAELYEPIADNELDIYVDDYYSLKRVIGYTTRKTKLIYVNTRYFDARSSKLVGSNILHEYGHKLGFSHDFSRTKAREKSICYQLNDIYEACYDHMFRTDTISLIKVCNRSWKRLWLFPKCEWKWL